jgi:hypothetical protein
MLLHRKGNLTIAKSKSSRLSHSVVISLPLEPVLHVSTISRYEADLSDSVVSFIFRVHRDISSGHNCENYDC